MIRTIRGGPLTPGVGLQVKLPSQAVLREECPLGLARALDRWEAAQAAGSMNEALSPECGCCTVRG